MTFIDWSDPEGMFGLLVDHVADERGECSGDPDRQCLLSSLFASLKELQARLPEIPIPALTQKLRELEESAGPEFAGDPVMVHLRECIEELEKV